MEQTVEKQEKVDNILDSVSDKILAKRKLKRTIISSVILSVVVIISAVFISLASISCSLHPNFLRNADGYRVFIGGTEKTYIDEDSNGYDDFMKEYSSQFQTSILSAMFTGRLGGYEIKESDTPFYSNNTEKTGMSTTLSNDLGNNYIQLFSNFPYF